MKIIEHTSRKLVLKEESAPTVLFLTFHSLLCALFLASIILLGNSGVETITCRKLYIAQADCTLEYSKLMGRISTQPRLMTGVKEVIVKEKTDSEDDSVHYVIYLSGSQGNYQLQNNSPTDANKLNHFINNQNLSNQNQPLVIKNDNLRQTLNTVSTLFYLILFLLLLDLWCIFNFIVKEMIIFDKNKNICQVVIIKNLKRTHKIAKEFFLEQIQKVVIELEKNIHGPDIYVLYLILPDETKKRIDSSFSSEEEEVVVVVEVETIARTITDFLGIELRKNY
ncbi:MAG: hypothetical protein EA365_10355 [Gloeocapsa sp. DLM2.Bin57]|nr:MAG: hypothetical protein EA365_10355 [Gloeocapsa sp. DLM2.Bin57]